MDSFNKVISFILGLVVVIVFFAVVTGRVKIGKFNPPVFSKRLTPTPTPTPISSINIPSTDQPQTTTKYNNYKTQNPKTIPATGLPTFFIPTLIGGALGGSFLKKAGKK